MQKTLINIGHRGAKGYEPENTLLSVQRALALGAKYIEVDVYLIEGELLVFHDNLLDRTSDGKGYIYESSLQYLRKLNAGKQQQIPTLFEVCELIDKKACVNIELKGADTADAVASFIAARVKQGWSLNAFLVSSFIHRQLAELKQISPEILTGALTGCQPIDEAKFAEDLGCFSVHPTIEFIDQQFVDDAHARGLKVFVYTVNHPLDLARMAAIGADGVYSDFPDRVLNFYEQGKFKNSWLE